MCCIRLTTVLHVHYGPANEHKCHHLDHQLGIIFFQSVTKHLQVSLDRWEGTCFHGNQHTAAVVDVHFVSASSYHHFQLNNKTITSSLHNPKNSLHQ